MLAQMFEKLVLEPIVTIALRFVIWLLDVVLDNKREAREYVFSILHEGLWMAYCSFHAVERIHPHEDPRFVGLNHGGWETVEKPISLEDERHLESWHHS